MTKNPIYLGINVDHVATIRQARGTSYPDPVEMALLAEQAGADGITMHIREDRRHIVQRDIERMASLTQTKLNMEMAATPEMHELALKVMPSDVCIVPEKREELTTEGGLDVLANMGHLTELCSSFNESGVMTSLFIDPDKRQIDAALRVKAPVIEIHTGKYADLIDEDEKIEELNLIVECSKYAHSQGLIVNAGHGLHYTNTAPVAQINEINELNIGHSVIARAIHVGMHQAVSDLKQILLNARAGV